MSEGQIQEALKRLETASANLEGFPNEQLAPIELAIRDGAEALREVLRQRDDLVVFVRRIHSALDKNKPAIAEQAYEYLKREGLQGKPLRSGVRP
jgi:hypothetical protein